MDIQLVSFLSKDGYKYIIKFKQEDQSFAQIRLISVSIDLHSEKTKGLGLKDLISIAKIFKKRIASNNVILSYVCSNTPIQTSARNESLSPQEYRGNLFDKLFRFIDKNEEYYKKDLIIENQYVSFISFYKNAELVDKCSEYVSDKLTAN